MDDKKWVIDKSRYAMSETSKAQDMAEGRAAFQALREVFYEWRKQGIEVNAALGGDSSSGEWSMVYEDGLWAVFIAERGIRYEPSFFFSAWDAINYIGFNISAAKDFPATFYRLVPVPVPVPSNVQIANP
jgi:hypothetical protein